MTYTPPTLLRSRKRAYCERIWLPERELYKPRSSFYATMMPMRPPIQKGYLAGNPAGSGGGVGPTPVDLGTFDIRPYLRLSNGWYSIPNGDYFAGDLTDAAHASTGLYGGAVVLQPTSFQGATIHQDPPGTTVVGSHNTITANGDLAIQGTSQRTCMMGFKFLNGNCRILGNTTATGPKARFAYCDFQFPTSVWINEPGFPNTNYHDTPHLTDTWVSGTSNFPDHCQLYGCTLSNSGTALYPRAGCVDFTAIGCDIGALDNGGHHELEHPDGMGANGGNTTVTLNDCYFHPGRGNNDNTCIIVENLFGGATLNMARVWCTGAGGPGINLEDDTGTLNSITVVLNDLVYVWNNFPTFDPDETSWNYIEGWNNGTQFCHTPNCHGVVNMTNPGNLKIGTANAPTGTDPGTAWRNAHPYSGMINYFNTIGWL